MFSLFFFKEKIFAFDDELFWDLVNVRKVIYFLLIVNERPKQKSYASMKTRARESPFHHLMLERLLLWRFPFSFFKWNGRSC